MTQEKLFRFINATDDKYTIKDLRKQLNMTQVAVARAVNQLAKFHLICVYYEGNKKVICKWK